MKYNKLKFLILSFIFCLICNTGIFAYTVNEVIDEKIVLELQNKKNLERCLFNVPNADFIYTPNTELADKTKKMWPASKKPPVYIAEELYLLKKEDLGENVTIENASKIMRSISKMQGMLYYSNTHKKEKVLYKECYRIKGPKDLTRIDDDVTGTADGKIMYCVQNDSSFGKTNYRLEYHQTEKEVSADFISISPLYAGPVKTIDTDDLRISVVITDCDDYLLVYMAIKTICPSMPVFKKTMDESFSARLNAIYKWFIKQF